MLPSFTTGAHMGSIGLPLLTTPLVPTASTSSLPTSTRRITTPKVMVSQFAVLFPYQKLNKILTLISSTSPSVIVENAPLNFVRGGWYSHSNGQIYDKGMLGICWSTTALDSTIAYHIHFTSSDFSPQYGN